MTEDEARARLAQLRTKGDPLGLSDPDLDETFAALARQQGKPSSQDTPSSPREQKTS